MNAGMNRAVFPLTRQEVRETVPAPIYARLTRSSAAVTAIVVAASLAVGPAASAQAAPVSAQATVPTQTQAQQRQQITDMFNTMNARRAAKGFKPLKLGVAATAVLQDYVNQPGQDPAGPDSLEFSKRIRGHAGYHHQSSPSTTWYWEWNSYTEASAYSVVGMVSAGSTMHAVGYKYAAAPAETFDTAAEYFAYLDLAQVTGTTPTVSGDGVWGGTLSVKPGSWPAGTAFAYQWFYTNTYGYSWAVDNSDHAPVDTIHISDIDMRKKLSVRVTATLPGNRTNVQWIEASDFIAVPGYVEGPAAISATGLPEPGGTLTSVPGTWEATATLSYQWFSGGNVLPGASSPTFTIPMDAGSGTGFRVVITGSKIGKRDTVVSSLPIAVEDLNITRPSILVGNPWFDLRGGGPQLGEVLSGHDMKWMDGVVISSRQWKRDGADIPGATTDKYTLTTADIGKAITFVVTGTLPGYKTRTVSSDPTELIAARRPVVQNTLAPKIVGTGLLGKTVTSTPGTWTAGTKLSYQWFWVAGVTSAPITGATGSSYTPTPDLNGYSVKLQVTGTLNGYDPKQVETTPLSIRKAVVVAPSISAKSWFAGDLISASVWNSGAMLTYQWKRNGIAIPGATGASYRLGIADIGKTVTLTVKGSLAGYPTASATSNVTSRIGQRAVQLLAQPTTSYGNSGTLPKAGQRVRVMSAGRWTPGAKISYQWRLNGVAVRGAVWSAYVIPATAAGKRLTLTVTASIPYWKSASTVTPPVPVLRR